MQTLHDITDDLQALYDLIAEAEGDITGDEAIIDEWFQTIGDQLEGKVDNYCALIKEFEARAQVRKDEAARIKRRATVDENNARRLKDRLHHYMAATERRIIDTTRFKVTIAKAGGRLPVLFEDDIRPGELDERFQVVRIELNKEAVREALDNGEALAFARLGARGEYLKLT